MDQRFAQCRIQLDAARHVDRKMKREDAGVFVPENATHKAQNVGFIWASRGFGGLPTGTVDALEEEGLMAAYVGWIWLLQ